MTTQLTITKRSPSKVVYVRIPSRVYTALNRAAEDAEVSVAHVIKTVLEKWTERRKAA